MHAVTASDGVNSGVTLGLIIPLRDIAPATPTSRYKYSVVVGRVPGSTTTSAVRSLDCTITVSSRNRNPATSPLDEDE